MGCSKIPCFIRSQPRGGCFFEKIGADMGSDSRRHYINIELEEPMDLKEDICEANNDDIKQPALQMVAIGPHMIVADSERRPTDDYNCIFNRQALATSE